MQKNHNELPESRGEIQSKKAVWNSYILFRKNKLYFKVIAVQEKQEQINGCPETLSVSELIWELQLLCFRDLD